MPFEIVDLAAAPPDRAACYALFRTYLFDYRAPMSLPLLFLVDERGFAHKVYPSVPEAGALKADLRALEDGNRLRHALPFPGKYYTAPHRNYFRLGAAFYWAGYPQEALIYLEEVIRSTPQNAKAVLAVGHIHLEAGRHGDAREYLERAVRLNPGSADAWIHLGSLEEAVEDHAAALRDFEKALAILPDSTFALISAGRAQGKLGQTRRRRNYCGGRSKSSRAMPKPPTSLDSCSPDRIAPKRRGNGSSRRSSSQPDHASAINNLGVLYMRMQKPQDAIAAFRYGIQVAPDDETAYVNLARVYVVSGDRAKARETLQQLISRRPDSTAARKGIGGTGRALNRAPTGNPQARRKSIGFPLSASLNGRPILLMYSFSGLIPSFL